MRRVLFVLFALVVAAMLLPTFALAQHGHGHGGGAAIGQGHGHGAGIADNDNDSSHKGWNKGKKTGWKGGDEPPGQEKKEGRTRHHARRYGDRDLHRSTHAPVHRSTTTRGTSTVTHASRSTAVHTTTTGKRVYAPQRRPATGTNVMEGGDKPK